MGDRHSVLREQPLLVHGREAVADDAHQHEQYPDAHEVRKLGRRGAHGPRGAQVAADEKAEAPGGIGR